jgi:hypothetical protein
MMHGLPNLIDADTFRPLRPLRAAGGIIPYVSNFRAVAVDQMAGPIAPALRAQVTDAPRAAGALVVWSSIRRVSSIAPGPFLLGRCRYSSRDRLIEPDLSCGPIGWWLQKAPSKWPRSADSDRYAITGYRCGLFLSSEQPGARDHPGNPGVENDTRSRRGLRGCVLRAPCVARSARTRRSMPAAVNRCQARSADLLSSDACSRCRIDAEAAQSRRGSGHCKGLATTDERCN